MEYDSIGKQVALFSSICLQSSLFILSIRIVVGRPGWWLLLSFIPFVNLVIAIIVNIDLAKSFGKSVFVWGILLLTIFSAIGYILLGFGSSTYRGPAAQC